MALYYFHIEGGESYEDEQGTELASLAEARDEAIRALSDALKDGASQLWAGTDLTLSVTDHKGLALFQIVVTAYNAAATFHS